MDEAQGPNGQKAPAPEDLKAGPSFLDRIFLRLKEIFLLGGVGLLVIAGAIATENPAGNFGGFTCGLAVAGGLCFVATALLHRGT